MRALTMDELGFVSGGDDTVIVTGPRYLNRILEEMNSLDYDPEDFGFNLMGGGGGGGIGAGESGEFTLTGLNAAQRARLAAFLANTTRTRNANGTVTVTFNLRVSISGNVPFYGNYQFNGQAGDNLTGSDRSGGSQGGANGIPDLLDALISGGGTITWG